MTFRGPFDWITPSARGRVFAVVVVLTLAVMAGMYALGLPLQTGAAPLGIVSLELAGTRKGALEILETWGPDGLVSAGLSLGLDFLFIPLYVSAVGLACMRAAEWLAGRLRGLAALGVGLAWAQVAAGALDALENYALIQVLLGAPGEIWPLLARWCAIPKFQIVAAGLGYLLLGSLGSIVRRLSSR